MRRGSRNRSTHWKARHPAGLPISRPRPPAASTPGRTRPVGPFRLTRRSYHGADGGGGVDGALQQEVPRGGSRRRRRRVLTEVSASDILVAHLDKGVQLAACVGDTRPNIRLRQGVPECPMSGVRVSGCSTSVEWCEPLHHDRLADCCRTLRRRVPVWQRKTGGLRVEGSRRCR